MLKDSPCLLHGMRSTHGDEVKVEHGFLQPAALQLLPVHWSWWRFGHEKYDDEDKDAEC